MHASGFLWLANQTWKAAFAPFAASASTGSDSTQVDRGARGSAALAGRGSAGGHRVLSAGAPPGLHLLSRRPKGAGSGGEQWAVWAVWGGGVTA